FGNGGSRELVRARAAQRAGRGFAYRRANSGNDDSVVHNNPYVGADPGRPGNGPVPYRHKEIVRGVRLQPDFDSPPLKADTTNDQSTGPIAQQILHRIGDFADLAV